MQSAARQAGIAFDNTLYNQRAEQWARSYTDDLLAELGTTTERIVGDAVGDWIKRDGATIGELNEALTPAFGAARANAIAVTETTRAFANGQEEAYKAEGITEWIWRTNKDEMVCKYCGGANNKTVKIGEPFGHDAKGNPVTKPPFHPNCRCWVAPKVSKDKKPKFEQAVQQANTQANKPIKKLSDVDINARIQADFTKFINDFESEISKQNYETAGAFKDGSKVSIKDGSKSSVSFTESEIDSFRGGVLTHNHPRGSTFSVEDIKMMAYAELTEIRATNPNYVYIMQNPNGVKIQEKNVRRAYNRYLKSAIMEMKNDPLINPYNRAWEIFAEKNGLIYRKEDKNAKNE
ncbi:MAG: minor capsid protein [Anaerolineales bacterium]|nr:minor capsid protein [Anaerolineales bacterium]